jgi:cellulose synthase/poly-beta-1,6-N-acetylglucosamine synthase-like glycosyltransferase
MEKTQSLTRSQRITESRENSQVFIYKGIKYNPHNDLLHRDTALYRFSSLQKVILFLTLALLIYVLISNWHTTLVALIAVLTTIYFTDLLFNLLLIFKGYSKNTDIQVTNIEIQEYDKELPMYTILCPLYKEAHILPQFITSMSKLDYPVDKLQILLLLEQDDTNTIEKAKTMNLPSQFEIVIVPHSNPKTKPKACNFGLKIAKGEYVVIYDAEDVPEITQLKQAVIAFKNSEKNIACIQAKLNFYNPHQNLLTRIFTAEYSVWFDLVLTGLQSINAPIPLGGTSNHFKTTTLRDIGGWDSFNVTEDCDLGIRLVKKGYKTAILNSTTYEEANSDVMNWYRQRTRWIKGYIQTYFVHMRYPREFISNYKDPHLLTFQLIVGGKVSSMLINPIMWILTISYFALRPTLGTSIESLFPMPVFYMSIFSLVVGNFLYIYYYVVGCAKRGHDDIIKYIVLVPFYWLGMSIAAYTAIIHLIYKPHHWAKTVHGLHMNNSKGETQAASIIGGKLVDL